MKKPLEWEVLAYDPGVTWHDRRGDTECARVEVGTPWGLGDMGDPAEVLTAAAEVLDGILGEVRHYSAQQTRDRVRSRWLNVIYFDFQAKARGGRWLLTFKVKDGEGGVSPGELAAYLADV